MQWSAQVTHTTTFDATVDPIDAHYDHDVALRGRYLGPCDCHLLARAGDDGAHSDLPDPTCPKCQGEGELYASKETP